MRHRIDIDTSKQSTPQVNNTKSTKTKLTLHKKIVVQDAVALPPHSSFHILSCRIAPDSTSNGSNSTFKQVTINCTLKTCLVTLSMAKNDNNAIALVKAVNTMMNLIHGIEGDANKVKI